MNATTKIVIGALATTALAWFMHGPMGFGANCAASAPAVAATAAVVPATAEAVASCQTKVDETIKGQTINFASGGATIAPASLPLVDAVAAAVKDCAGTTMEIAGHTDATGGDAANQALSESRANSVAKAMTERGVPADRLVAKGYGETKPVEAGTTAAANAKNRRIEFHLASAGAAAPAAQ